MRLFTAIRIAALSVLGAVVLGVPATEGPVASTAFANGACGSEGQRACTIVERPGLPCDRGLNQVASSIFDLGTCEGVYTVVPSDNQSGSDYRNPQPNADFDRRPRQPRYSGRYDDHGGMTAIEICNRSNTPEIYAAIAYYDWGIYGDAPNWSSAGWWSLQRGECREVGLIDDYEEDWPYDGQVYLMAVGGGLAWEGNAAAFCVDRSGEFHIRNADTARCTEENTLYGYEFTVTPGELNHFDFDG